MELICQKVKKNIILLKADNSLILTALSGGKDSIALLNILYQLKDELNIKLNAAYLNHNLRGKESAKEQKFVMEACKKLKVPLFIKVISSDFWKSRKGSSVEMAARKERYDFFKKISEENGINFIATAHHFNDRVETFFINLLRGTSPSSLLGIPEKNKNIIRPILNIARIEIESYIKKNKLSFIEDSTNKKEIYKRNIIRKKVLPILEKIKPGYFKSFENFFEIFGEEEKLFSILALKKLKKISVYYSDKYTALELKHYKKTSPVIQKRIVKIILKKLSYPAKPNKNMIMHLSGIKDKYRYKSKKFISFSKNSLLWFVNEDKAKAAKTDEKFINTISDIISINNYKISLDKKIFSFDEKSFMINPENINFPLKLRKYNENDEIKISEDKFKKIKSILYDNGIPEMLQTEVKILENPEGKIIGFFFNKFFRVSFDYYIIDFSKELIIIHLKYGSRKIF